jgi:uncharacterized protein
LTVTVDANILVYASNTSDPAYTPARALVQRLAAGPDLVYLFWPTIIGYLGVVTHPAILPRPLSFADATSNISALLQRPHVRSPGEGEDFWGFYLETMSSHARAKDTAEAHLASLMRQHGVAIIYTRDRGYRRYSGIKAHDPISQPLS